MPPKDRPYETYFGVVSDGVLHGVHQLKGTVMIEPERDDNPFYDESLIRMTKPETFTAICPDTSFLHELLDGVDDDSDKALVIEQRCLDMKVPMRVCDLRKRKKGNRGNKSFGLSVYKLRTVFPHARIECDGPSMRWELSS